MESGDREEIVEDEEDDEEDVNTHELEDTDGKMSLQNFSIKNVLYALNGIVIIYLNSVVINVFVRNVINKR